MKKILYVEDDALIARVYSQKLTAAGFEVSIAQDGLAAVQFLRQSVPDLIVLDLLMPRLTGVDVLKFIRQQPALKNTRIIVFSNSFLSNLVEQVAQIGVEEALVKASVTPAQLVGIINRTLDDPQPGFLSAEAIAAHLSGGGSPKTVSSPAPINATANPASTPVATTPQAPVKAPVVSKTLSSFEARAQSDFLDQAPSILKSIRQVCKEFVEAGDTPIESRKLADLRRKIGFVAQTLGMAGRQQLAQLCSALEALLFELEDKPAMVTDSIRHTIAATVALIGDQFDTAAVDLDGNAGLKILVVDDDQVSSRAVVLALGRVKLAASSVSDPFEGLKQLQGNSYGLVMLDVNMPGMDGITLCDQMRGLPQHKKTPVIFVTSQTDFRTRARTLLSGGNELIAKPILPTELCVKVLSHLVKSA